MGRPRSVAEGRPIVVAIRLSPTETQRLDTLRGSLSRSGYLRQLLTTSPHPDPHSKDES